MAVSLRLVAVGAGPQAGRCGLDRAAGGSRCRSPHCSPDRASTPFRHRSVFPLLASRPGHSAGCDPFPQRKPSRARERRYEKRHFRPRTHPRRCGQTNPGLQRFRRLESARQRRRLPGLLKLCPQAAQRLAEISQRGDPHHAWVAGLLAPLGWLAVCAVDGDLAAACLDDSAFTQDPVLTQQRRWGYDHAGIARRLARRWRLPGLAPGFGRASRPAR